MERVETKIYHFADGSGWVSYIPRSTDPIKIDQLNMADIFVHCDDGPAICTENIWRYMVNNCLHRYDGPALIYRYGKLEDLWFIRDTLVPEDAYLDWLIDMGMDRKNLSDEDKLLIDMKWGR